MIKDLMLSINYDKRHNKQCVKIRDVDPYTGEISTVTRTVSGELVANIYHILTGRDLKEDYNENKSCS